MLKFVIKHKPTVYYSVVGLPFFGNKDNRFDRTEPHIDIIPKTGLERVYALFQTNKVGEMSNEMYSFVQLNSLSCVCGGIVGGLLHSKRSFESYVIENQTTRFVSPYQAKRHMNDFVIRSFLEGSVRWGARCFIFTAMFSSVVILISTYRGYNGILEYTAGGVFAGSFARIFLGLKGMISGGLIGGAMATCVGVLCKITEKISGTTIDDVREWQAKMTKKREEKQKKSIKDPSVKQPLLQTRDEFMKQVVSSESADGKVYVLLDSNLTDEVENRTKENENQPKDKDESGLANS